MERFLLSKLAYKYPQDQIDWLYVSPKLILLRDYWLNYSYEKKLPVLCTSIIRAKIEGISTSNSHAEGRAFDASVHGWSTDDIDSFVADCNKEFAQSIGAISQMDLKARAVLYHFGTGPHFHFQVRP